MTNKTDADIQAADPVIEQADLCQPNEHEAWVFQNPAVLAALRQAIKETGSGQFLSRGSFARHVDTVIDGE